jgi:hypothetical protein
LCLGSGAYTPYRLALFVVMMILAAAESAAVVACVQTVWPQSGRVSCDLLTRQICIPAATVTDFFWLFFYFFKDKSLCFQRGN